MATRPKRLRIRAKHGLTHSSLGRKKNQARRKIGRAWEKAELEAKTGHAREKNKLKINGRIHFTLNFTPSKDWVGRVYPQAVSFGNGDKALPCPPNLLREWGLWEREIVGVGEKEKEKEKRRHCNATRLFPYLVEQLSLKSE